MALNQKKKYQENPEYNRIIEEASQKMSELTTSAYHDEIVVSKKVPGL